MIIISSLLSTKFYFSGNAGFCRKLGYSEIALDNYFCVFVILVR